MKKLCVMVAALAVLIVAPAFVLASDAPAGKTHDLTVEFVSFDAKAKTMTFKDAEGAQKTVPVMATAMTEVPTLHAGQKVTLTCADNDKGEHQGVAHVKPVKAA